MALVVWLIEGLFERQIWLPFLFFVLSTYIIVELNTAFALLRTYSRMVSCAFIVLCCGASFFFTQWANGVMTFCFVASFANLFKSYQDRESVGHTFYSFVAYGMASVFWVQMLWVVPFAWILMIVCLRSFSMRTFMASVFGILTPYWFASVYFVYTMDYETPLAHLRKLADFGPLAKGVPESEYMQMLLSLGVERYVCFAFVVALFVTGVVHYLRNRFNDKLNTRMYYDIFITYGMLFLAGILLQPQHFDALFHLLIVCTSPLIAHFITHTRTFITNISFMVIVAVALCIIVLNLII